jgi:predicted ATP-dependent endonuclease of OLD family
LHPVSRGYDLGKAGQARTVIVEGQFDAVLVHALAKALGSPAYKLEVVPAGGVSNLAALASAANSTGIADPVLIIADGDGHPDVVRRKIEDDLARRGPDLADHTDIVVLDPLWKKRWRY